MLRKISLKISILLIFISAPCLNGYCDEGLHSLVIEADSFKKIEEPFRYHEVYRGGELIGYCFNTSDVAPDVEGYSGPMEILVAIDIDYRIINLKILRHAETPEYAADITGPEFLDQFKGKGPQDPLKIGNDVDAITHATISCNAVCDVLREGIARMRTILQKDKKEVVVPKAKGVSTLKGSGMEPREASYYKVMDE